ncbi:hypothetical protein D1AOALGA4SA_3068 [Olavius algarvensis Delta 1 endosymbiont]|nr:hypothetical protein D1AOALGA4SA_3068 [Olavius algarvensis Delta 1 endosymbiont]
MTKTRNKAKKIFVFPSYRVFVIKMLLTKCQKFTIKTLPRVLILIQKFFISYSQARPDYAR